jgi:hypothetical protein
MIFATPNAENATGAGLVGGDLPLDRGLGDSKSITSFRENACGVVVFFTAVFPKNRGCNAFGLVGVVGGF